MNKALLFLCLSVSPFVLRGAETMRISAIQTPNATKPVGPFSQAIRVSGAQEIIFISGQLPIDPATDLLESDPAKATMLCMQNLAAILKEAGMDFSNVVRTTILLADINDFPVVNKVYESYLKKPYPARLTFQAGALPKQGRVEIEMIAVR